MLPTEHPDNRNHNTDHAKQIEYIYCILDSLHGLRHGRRDQFLQPLLNSYMAYIIFVVQGAYKTVHFR